MKLHIMSDLHLASCDMQPLPVLADALVLAGDIGDGLFGKVVSLTENYRKAKVPVVYAPGNHEFEGHEFSSELRHLSRECHSVGITLLYNRSVTISGMRFLGTTLWTDFSFGGKASTSMRLAQSTMYDFAGVSMHKGRLLRPEDTVRFHRTALAFLERLFRENVSVPTVLVTHHGISEKSIHSLNAAYVTSLEERVLRWGPRLAVHGHVHRSFDYQLGKTRVLVNPRGVVRELQDYDGTMLQVVDNKEFDPALVVEV